MKYLLIVVASTLLVSCAPVLEASKKQPPLPAYAPLAEGQTWNVKGEALTLGSDATVVIEKLMVLGGLYSNTDQSNLVAVHRRKEENPGPVLEYSTLRKRLLFKWRTNAGNYTCEVNDVHPEHTKMKGTLLLADRIVGNCTATLAEF